MSQMLPLMAMMMNNKDFEKNTENMKNGGNPMDMLGGMQGANPEMLRMFKLFSEMNGKKGKGGAPADMLFEMMGAGNPQFKQMKTMMDMFQHMNKPKKSQKNGGVNAMSAEVPPISELKPIRSIAPDAIHRSMEDYLKKKKLT